MAWLVIDLSNTEYISNVKPERDTTYLLWYSYSYYGYHKETSVDNMIELPKGTIRKILGRDLTWEDEPVEI